MTISASLTSTGVQFIKELNEIGTSAGALSFAGNTQWLSVPSVTGLNLGDPSYPGALDGPSFTIEFWMYATSFANEVYIMDKDGVAFDSYAEYGFKLATDGTVTFYVGHGDDASTIYGGEQNFTVGTIALNTWYHVAATQSPTNQIKTFLNGTLTGTTTRTQRMVDGGKALWIGWCQDQPTNSRFAGRLTNIRIVKGTALYTSSFEMPTSAPTAVSGTSLLLNAENSANFLKDDSTNNASITNNGVTWSSAGPSSVYIPATSIKTGLNSLIATEFDEVTINPISNGLAKKEYKDGRYMVAGYFDEVTSF